MKAEEAVHTIMLNSDWEHVGETKYRKVIINDKEFEEYKLRNSSLFNLLFMYETKFKCTRIAFSNV